MRRSEVFLFGCIALLAGFFLAVASQGCVVPPDPVEPGGKVSCRGANAVLEELGGCGVTDACSAGGDCRTFLESCEALESDLPGLVDIECLVVARSCDAFFACGGAS